MKIGGCQLWSSVARMRNDGGSSSSSTMLAVRLCALGFLCNAKPSEPFLTLYLNETKHLSDQQLSTEVYPYSTLGAFLFLLPMSLLAEVIGCRPVILIGMVCREITRVTLIFGHGVQTMAAMQLFYSAGVSADAVYFAYVYQAVPRSQYARMTAFVLAAYHVGNVLAALTAEALVAALPALRADLTPLFWCSLVLTSLGLVAFALLPPPCHAPPRSLAHYLLHTGPRGTVLELRRIFAPRASRAWLLWFGLAASGEAIVENFFQLQLVAVDSRTPFGLLEAGLEAGLAAGALLALCSGASRFAASRPAAFLALTCISRAAALALSAHSAQHNHGGGGAHGQGGGAFFVPASLNVLAAVLYGLQRSVGSTMLATSAAQHSDGDIPERSHGSHDGGRGSGRERDASGSGGVGSSSDARAGVNPEGEQGARFPVIFGFGVLLANGGAAALGGVGAGLRWGANSYYWATSAMLCSLALLAPLLLLGPCGGAHAKQRLEEED